MALDIEPETSTRKTRFAGGRALACTGCVASVTRASRCSGCQGHSLTSLTSAKGESPSGSGESYGK